MRLGFAVLVLSVVGACAGGLAAQGTPFPVWRAVGVDLDSGPLHNPLPVPSVVWSETVSIAGAHSLQLLFDRAEFASPGDTVIVRSVADLEAQPMDALVRKQWQDQTALFNGDTVEIEVILEPFSEGHLVIGTAMAGIEMPRFGVVQPDSQCGFADDRTPSSDGRVFRLLDTVNGGVCTGWLISSTNAFLTAGHCTAPFPGALRVAQFNVPLSTPGGALQNPPVGDQYPVNVTSIRFSNNGIGDDWAAARLHPNTFGQTAISRQGAFVSVSTAGPFLFPIMRITGFGADFDDPQRNFVQQTHTGPLGVSFINNGLAYEVDTEGGNSGSPVFLESTGEAMAIHTNGGCAPPFSLNSGTDTRRGELQNAIAETVSQGSVSLQSGSAPVTITPQSEAIFDYPAGGADWHVIAVSGASDWDIESESRAGSGVRVASALGGNSADLIVANGKIGPVTPISGRAFRFSGSSDCQIQARRATTMTVGGNRTDVVNPTDIVLAYQFQVPFSGLYDININGYTGWRWRILDPLSTSDWRGYGAGLVAFGTVGSGVAQDVQLQPGWHLLVLVRDGGFTGPSLFQITLSVCEARPTLTLDGQQRLVLASCQDFSLNPTVGRWNGVVIAGDSDSFDIDLGREHSRSPVRSNYVLANGTAGPVTPTTGSFHRVSGSGLAVAQAVVADVAALNAPFSGILAANDIARLVQFTVFTPGTYDLAIAGDSSLQWRFHPGSGDSGWINRASADYWAQVGTFENGIPLGAGTHAILIADPAGTWPFGRNFEVLVVPSAPTIPLNSAITSFADLARIVSIPTDPLRWNLVAVSGAGTMSYELNIGTMTTRSSNGGTAYALADGRRGAVTPTLGTVVRTSGGGTLAATKAAIETVALNTPRTIAWSFNDIIRAFEFEVTVAGTYDIAVSDTLPGSWSATSVLWTLHAPAADSAWRDTLAQSGTFRTVGSNSLRRETLQPGVYCIALTSGNWLGTGSGQVTLSVVSPNPQPVLSGISPPSVTVAQIVNLITLSGSGFLPSSVVRVGGSPVGTSYVNATTLIASLPASVLSEGQIVAVDVFNPLPGGGISEAQSLTVLNRVPTLNAIAPSTVQAGSANTTLTLTGSSFFAGSVVRIGSQNLATTFVNSSTLTAVVPAAQLLTAGPLNVTVFHPLPGGGTSSAQVLTVTNPLPTAVSVTPNFAVAGAANTTVTINGGPFNAASVARWNGTNLTTTVASTAQLTALLPQALLATPGTVGQISVFAPTPGGGTSANLPFTVRYAVPTLGGLSPASAVAGSTNLLVTFAGTGFGPASVVRIDGTSLATTFVNATTLRATISAASMTTSGVRNLTVYSPSPGGGTSASQPFTVANPLPVLTSLSPSFVVAGAATTQVTLTGSGFQPSAVVRWNGANLSTTFVDATTLRASIPAANLTVPGTVASLAVFHPAPGGGTSASQSFTVRYPTPAVNSLAPSTRIAGSGGFTLDVTGTGFYSNTELLFAGTPLSTTLLNPTTLRATVPQVLAEGAGGRAVTARNPAPGGGTSAPRTFTLEAPVIASLAPNLIPVQGFGTNTTIRILGSGFHTGSVVYANSDPLATTFVSATELTCVINSIAQPALRVNCGFVFSVRNSNEAWSNFSILRVGGSNNRGTISRSPIAPNPGESYRVRLFNGTAGSPFTMFLDFGSISATTTYPFITSADNYSLNVRPFDPGTGEWFILFDGLGLYRTAEPIYTFDANASFLSGPTALNNPLFGVSATVQTVFLDPSAAPGYRLSFARHPDRL